MPRVYAKALFEKQRACGAFIKKAPEGIHRIPTANSKLYF